MRNYQTTSRLYRPAYTLVEIVVVLAIMAILWAIAAPRYAAAMSRYRAEAAARRIAADLAMARQQAIQTSSSVTVSFDQINNAYTIPGITSLDRKSSNYTVNLAADPYQVTLGTVPFLLGQVTFNAYGSADQSGTITVQSASGFQWTITLEATFGKVSVSGT
jgi:prepilin-type N-terminal cleavage/methylation domain-containing protein